MRGFARCRLQRQADRLGNRIIADIGQPLSPGSYTVRWQTASADGHPIRGFDDLPQAADMVRAVARTERIESFPRRLRALIDALAAAR